MRIHKDNLLIKKISVFLITFMLLVSFAGCSSAQMSNESDSQGEITSGKGNAPASKKDNSQPDYETYIHDALASVSDDRKEVPPEPTPDPVKTIHVTKDKLDIEDMGDEDIFISASDEDIDNPDTVDETLPEDNPEGESGDESSELTPDEFEVGQSCIYIQGEDDDTYGSDLITELNNVRKQLGYPELTVKTGLNNCASRRTREIASYLNHTRPNGEPYYSMAPQYFKAEMLAIDKGTAEETVQEWIKDPVSRELVFTNKYTSVGGACFVCNDLNCIVVAFGY